MRPEHRIPDQEDFRFSCELEVRFRDLDAMGHVNNAVYLTYLEVARTGYFRALGHVADDESSLPAIFPFVLADISCKFLSPARLGDRLTVLVSTTEMGKKSFVLEYLVVSVRSGSPVAFGRSTQLCYDYEKGSTTPVPSELRSSIEELEGRKFLKRRPRF